MFLSLFAQNFSSVGIILFFLYILMIYCHANEFGRKLKYSFSPRVYSAVGFHCEIYFQVEFGTWNKAALN